MQKKMKKTMKSVKGFVGLEDPEERTFQDEFNDACSMSRKQRLYGFGICFCLGWLISILSTLMVPQIAKEPQKFAILYSVGNLVAISATFFLFGPMKQVKRMFDKIRIGATLAYLGALGFTLYAAFGLQQALWVILGLIVQVLASIWYAASYIPYGRKMIQKICVKMCNCVVGD